MYHEEKVINGVLCWRVTPDGEWTQYTPEALTVALTAERSRAIDMESGLIEYAHKMEAIKSAIGG